MRKSIIFTLGLMLGVFGMTGCSKDAANEHINGDVKEFTLISHAAAPDTRMVIEGDKTHGFNTAWEDGDKIGVYATDYVAGEEATNNLLYTCNHYQTAATGSDGKATFTGTIWSTGSNEFNLFAYYPYTSGSTYKDTDYQTGVDCTITDTQTMNGNSFDKSCAYMVAKTGLSVKTSAANDAYDIGNWQFRHVTAFINLSTKAISATGVSGDEIVKSATIEAVGIETNPTLAGSFQFNLENGEMTFGETPKSAVTVTVPDGTTLAGLSAWFVTNPFTLTADDELEIVINTNAHIIKKNVTIAKSFEAANAYTLNLTIDDKCTVSDAPVEPVTKWIKVTSLGDITDGEYVFSSYITASGYGYGYLPNPANTSSVPLYTTIENVSADGTELTAVTDDMIWQFTGTTSAMTIQNADSKYLYTNDNSNKGVRVGTTSCTWQIATVTGTGGFTFKNTTSNRYLAVYINNGGTPLDWRCYTSASTGTTANSNNSTIILFKKTTVTLDPSINVTDVAGVPARGGEGTTTYTITNFANDNVTVKSVSGCVTAATKTADGTITYTVAPNYTGEATSGTIVLESAANRVSATINVLQLADTFKAARTTVELDATAGAKTNVLISSDYDWTIDTSNLTGASVIPMEFVYNPDVTEPTNKEITILVTDANTGETSRDLGSFDIIRVDGKTITVTVTQKAPGAAAEKTATFEFSKLGWANGVAIATPAVVDDITITFDKATASNATAYYNTGAAVRMYPKSTCAVKGGNITKIEITYEQNKAASGICSLTPSAGSFDISDWSTAGTATWTGSGEPTFTVASTNNGALRVSKMVVTYEKPVNHTSN